MELIEELEKLKQELEQKALEKNEQCNIIDISYYDKIIFENFNKKAEPLYLVEKEVNGERKRELQIGDIVIADIAEDNIIYIKEQFAKQINKWDIVIQIRDITPISLKELERIRQEKQGKEERSKEESRETKETLEEENKKEQPKEKQRDANDIEIDMDKKITATKTFADLVPEVKEKQIKKVKIRRLDATRFEFYGENQEGKEIAIESLRTVEGTNPIKDITEVNKDGSIVEKDQVFAMFQIVHGTNEQNGNEGFTIDLEQGTGIIEVGYYRRSRDNEYTSTPVNLTTTNQKRNNRDVEEYADKSRNPKVNDNIDKANNILEEQEKTTLENIDDNPYNDISETRREYEETLIRAAAKRCKISEQGFRKILEQERKAGEPIEDSIERAEDEINEQVIGERRR